MLKQVGKKRTVVKPIKEKENYQIIIFTVIVGLKDAISDMVDGKNGTARKR